MSSYDNIVMLNRVSWKIPYKTACNDVLLRGSDVVNIGLKLCYWLPVVDLTQIISVWPACVYNMPVIAYYPPWYMCRAMIMLYFT